MQVSSEGLTKIETLDLLMLSASTRNGVVLVLPEKDMKENLFEILHNCQKY